MQINKTEKESNMKTKCTGKSIQLWNPSFHPHAKMFVDTLIRKTDIKTNMMDIYYKIEDLEGSIDKEIKEMSNNFNMRMSDRDMWWLSSRITAFHLYNCVGKSANHWAKQKRYLINNFVLGDGPSHYIHVASTVFRRASAHCPSMDDIFSQEVLARFSEKTFYNTALEVMNKNIIKMFEKGRPNRIQNQMEYKNEKNAEFQDMERVSLDSLDNSFGKIQSAPLSLVSRFAIAGLSVVFICIGVMLVGTGLIFNAERVPGAFACVCTGGLITFVAYKLLRLAISKPKV